MKLDDDGIDLFQIKPEEYGSKYSEQLMEQYKLYIEMADRVSARRSTANTFFLAANTLLISIFGAIVGKDASCPNSNWMLFPLFAVSGLSFSVAWFHIVRSYGQLNSGKFKVIHKIEEKLPLALFKAEWTILAKGRDPKLYRPLTDVERYAPLTFAMLYLLVLLILLYDHLGLTLFAYSSILNRTFA